MDPVNDPQNILSECLENLHCSSWLTSRFAERYEDGERVAAEHAQREADGAWSSILVDRTILYLDVGCSASRGVEEY